MSSRALHYVKNYFAGHQHEFWLKLGKVSYSRPVKVLHVRWIAFNCCHTVFRNPASYDCVLFPLHTRYLWQDVEDGERGPKTCLPCARWKVYECWAPEEPDRVRTHKMQSVCCLLFFTIGHILPHFLILLISCPLVERWQSWTLSVAACQTTRSKTTGIISLPGHTKIFPIHVTTLQT